MYLVERFLMSTFASLYNQFTAAFPSVIFFFLTFSWQIELSEMYFVPDPGASKEQCEVPMFKPVSIVGQRRSFEPF